MSNLTQRLEAATCGERELDAELAFRFMPGFVRGRSNDAAYAPSFTTSLDAALALVERCLPGWRWAVGVYGTGYQAALDSGGVFNQFHSEAPTPALALCLALIRALEPQTNA